MTDSETMRARFEAAIKRHGVSPSSVIGTKARCSCCGDPWPCLDNVANTRNLHDLNNAAKARDNYGLVDDMNLVLIYDPPTDPLGGDHAEA